MIDRISHSFRPDALERQIACLVDGELDESERRDLLLRLDASPDGWRRCALAFLEDQALRKTLGFVSTGDPRRSMPTSVLVANERRKPNLHARRYAAAMVCGAALLGSYWLGRSSGSRPDRPSIPVETTTKVANELPPVPGQPVGFLKWSDPNWGELPPRTIAVVADTPTNEEWARERPDTIPEYVRAQWERQGFRVNEDHRLMAVDIGKGRKGAVPVDEVEFSYVGQRPL